MNKSKKKDFKFGLLNNKYIQGMRTTLIDDYERNLKRKGSASVKNVDYKREARKSAEHQMNEYKQGRPYFFIELYQEENRDIYIGFPVYSGDNQNKINDIVKHKIDPMYQKVFYYFKQHGLNSDAIKGEPYISFRSPILIEKKFIDEIKPEYLDDISSLVGEGTKTEITKISCHFLYEKAEEIINQGLYIYENRRKIFNRTYNCRYKMEGNPNIFISKNHKLTTNKYLSRNLMLRGNDYLFKIINRKANSFVKSSKNRILKNEDEEDKMYKESVLDTNISDDKINVSFLDDRIRRRTPYYRYRGELKPMKGKNEASILQSGYENENHMSNDFILELTSDKEKISAHLKENSKLIVKGIVPEDRNTDYYFCYTAERHPLKDKTKNDIQKEKLVEKIINANDSIMRINKKEHSRIIGYEEKNKKFNSNYQVNCQISESCPPDKAIDLIITNYIFNSNIIGDKGQKYKFGEMFYYGSYLASIEMLTLEIKRKISEKTGIEFSADEHFRSLRENGKDILSNREIMGNMLEDADRIVCNIMIDLDSTDYETLKDSNSKNNEFIIEKEE